MDRKPQASQEIERLRAVSRAARSRLGADVAALRHQLDLPSRFRDSLGRHPTTWLAGSLASGLAASLWFRRKPAVSAKRRGFPIGLLGLTLTAARPLVKVWLAGLLKQWASDAFSHSSSSTGLPFFRSKSPTSPASSAHVHAPGPGSR
jgi:hypothetical protein